MANKKQNKRPATGARKTPAQGAGYIRARANGQTPAPPEPAPVEVVPATPAAPAKRRASPGWRLALLISLGVLVLVVLALGGWIAYNVYHPLPQTTGTLKLAGLSAPATVVRDKQGIPHITAATQMDLFRAQGYVVAQDRLWQMEFYRRVGEGRLSEVIGDVTLDTDEFVRTLGWRRAAEAELPTLPADIQADLQAYCDGVNAFLDSHQDALPVEFTILGYKPEHWAPVDVVTFGKVMDWNLSENWEVELTMADLQAKLGPQRAAQLLPAYPDSGTTIVPQSALPGNPAGHAPAPDPLAQVGLDQAGGLIGSNNWVVAGSHTADGHPLLANDPHLEVQNPSIWYAMQLRAQDGSFDAEGVTFAGVPGIVIGHNANIVWGVTNLGPDTQDLYVEKLDPAAHPGQYLYKGQWLPLKVMTETLGIKDETPLTLTITSTVHGPLLDAVDSQISQPTAFHWTALEPGGLIPAVLHLDHASNWAEFHQALSTWDVPGQNFVYADTQGNIGYQATGRWPIRAKGDSGLAPVDGSSGDFDWQGYVPYEQLPSVYNPAQGFLVTANNRVTPPSFPAQATGWWFPPFRAQRITQMIQATPKLSMDDIKTIEHDTHSVPAAHIGTFLAGVQGGDARTEQAAALFKNWDGNLSAGSPTAALYEITFHQILTDTFADDLGGTLAEEYLGTLTPAADMLVDQLVDDPNNAWWDDTTTTAHETRDDILRKSLTAAVGVLTDQQGDDMTQWSWGHIHTITFAHRLGVPPLGLLLNFGSYPTGGDETTVNVGTAAELFDTPNTFVQTSHPSMRMITDPQDWTRTQLVFAPGESGQPGSAHWGDQIAAWLDNGYNTLAWTDGQVQAATEATLTLTP